MEPIKSKLSGETMSSLILECRGLYINRLVSYNNMEGVIARVTDRGFGFITREGEEKDLFFHSNELQNVQFNDLREGDKVTFEVAEGPKGLNATNINKA